MHCQQLMKDGGRGGGCTDQVRKDQAGVRVDAHLEADRDRLAGLVFELFRFRSMSDLGESGWVREGEWAPWMGRVCGRTVPAASVTSSPVAALNERMQNWYASVAMSRWSTLRPWRRATERGTGLEGRARVRKAELGVRAAKGRTVGRKSDMEPMRP